jgi:hypothetical protein
MYVDVSKPFTKSTLQVTYYWHRKTFKRRKLQFGAKDAVSAWLLMQSQAHAVMSVVAHSGWDKYQTSCEEALGEAHQLWVKSESLVVKAAEAEIGSKKLVLLEECQKLLEACDCRVAAEEDILYFIFFPCS